MNVKRFQAKTSKDALAQARHFFGDDAVVLSTRPCECGVEIMALSAQAVQTMADAPSTALTPSGRRMAVSEERLARPASAAAPTARASMASEQRRDWGHAGSSVAGMLQARDADQRTPADGPDVDHDVEALAMSTLSFQDYVRERMLRRRQEALSGADAPTPAVARKATAGAAVAGRTAAEAADHAVSASAPIRAPGLNTSGLLDRAKSRQVDATAAGEGAGPAGLLDLSGKGGRAHRDASPQVLDELRQMKDLIEERFGTLAWLDKVQRSPAQGKLMQQLLGCGYSPALVRKVVDSLPADHDQEQVLSWAQQVLAHNLLTDAAQSPIEDRGGVYALIGSTGVGKTTTTAKLAAAFALKHGASDLGLITLDAYRVGAHDQLRAYGKILNVAVHIAHDKDALEDLLALLSTKKLVLIDTVGLAQRDARTAEMLEMLSHEQIQKLLVVNAAAQGETIDDVMAAYRCQQCAGVVLSKVDEAVKLGPALDAALRRRAKVIGVANGQRVPEDWQRAHADRLVRRSLHGTPPAAFELDRGEAGLVFSLRSETMRMSGGGQLNA